MEGGPCQAVVGGGLQWFEGPQATAWLGGLEGRRGRALQSKVLLLLVMGIALVWETGVGARPVCAKGLGMGCRCGTQVLAWPGGLHGCRCRPTVWALVLGTPLGGKLVMRVSRWRGHGFIALALHMGRVVDGRVCVG